MNCVILDDYQNVSLKSANWNELKNISVSNLNQHLVGNELVKALSDAEIIVVMRERTPITRELMQKLPKLKLIITSGMRNASIDKEAAKERNIIVCGTKSLKRPPMELTWALILNLSRYITAESNAVKNYGPWQSTLGTSLQGKTLGLLGLGHIGKLMVPVAKAFEMNVIAWSPNLTQERCDEVGVTLIESKEDLFINSDIISIHMVLSHLTRNLVTYKEMSLMKPSAFLVNTSRAEIVNQEDLIRILKEEKIRGAGIDVFEEEPLPQNHPLRQLDNVIATPHLGYVADTNYKLYFTQAVENINAFISNNFIRTLD
ncbi:D-2-hydroxyacid dehydrogenase family protein [Francisella adeliensis]|uniref:Hydroxyacid dehydrogenase n=1 Tax=Francisella adeliensis TaxID=2007306 RepID=A0A2Z4XX72_9GAMM|nr:D-2-hydroxyacid dehydrogenase family protein [Francisella adeliensis]AXA33316.1 hydroxyacid dehydrogenase [Francisella adeliensis]MBK2086437.1 D-2-hydroxyacid dehydrogenase family protein [Francisella adeliensis]MBK2097055.1 D-2-hydroxyacid dehydrogenase family protein [Francisella adeliensis]QIW11545.1 D-2-hydroxyacid dehydrogenase family protein [Francisella adeliensis]QIW13419.1 D-2-hydroxyacid dehydrogenase family protein [Francisella adeliensis]